MGCSTSSALPMSPDLTCSSWVSHPPSLVKPMASIFSRAAATRGSDGGQLKCWSWTDANLEAREMHVTPPSGATTVQSSPQVGNSSATFTVCIIHAPPPRGATSSHPEWSCFRKFSSVTVLFTTQIRCANAPLPCLENVQLQSSSCFNRFVINFSEIIYCFPQIKRILTASGYCKVVSSSAVK